jgi:C1A family cysteine protease
MADIQLPLPSGDGIDRLHTLINGKGTGALPSPPDSRDYSYAERLLAGDLASLTTPEAEIIVPEYRDMRRLFGPVYDQLNLGSCTAQAVAGAIEFIQWITARFRLTPSRLALYYFARYLMGPEYINQDSGAYVRTAIKGAVNYGASPENLWPYQIERFRNEPSQEALEAGLLRQALEYFRIQDGSITAMETCIAAGFPFVFGVAVAENFIPKRGVIPMPEGAWLGGHAMLAVGYSRRSRRILARNSWDRDWGIKGYAWIPYEYMEQAWDLWTLRAIENPEV